MARQDFAALKQENGRFRAFLLAALSMDEGAVRVAVHRLRKRYRELLRSEVADTLFDPAMVEGELATLLGAFG